MASAQGMHLQETLTTLRCLVWQVLYCEDIPIRMCCGHCLCFAHSAIECTSLFLQPLSLKHVTLFNSHRLC